MVGGICSGLPLPGDVAEALTSSGTACESVTGKGDTVLILKYTIVLTALISLA